MMKDKATYYRNLTNQFEDQLNDVNRQYFSDLRTYLITAGLFYDERAVNEQVYIILTDILEAQSNQETAQHFYGKDPQKLGNELIRELPKESMKKRVNLSLYLMSIMWLIKLLTDLSGKGALQLNVLTYLVMGLFSVLVVQLTFFLMHRSIYLKESHPLKKNKKIEFLAMWLVATVVISLYVVIAKFTPALMMIPIPNPLDIVLILVLTFGISGFVLIKKQKEFYSMLIMVFAFGALGLIQRLPQTANLLSGRSGMIWIVGILIVANIFYVIFTRSQMKKES